MADERDLAYLLVQLDVHAVDEQQVVAHAGLLKQAVAKAIGLRFETDVDHLVLAPSLGPRPADWIEVLHGSYDSVCLVSICCTFRPRSKGGVVGGRVVGGGFGVAGGWNDVRACHRLLSHEVTLRLCHGFVWECLCVDDIAQHFSMGPCVKRAHAHAM